MTVPYVKNRPMLAAVMVAGVVAIAANPLPHKIGLMVAAIAGMTAGVYTEKLTGRQYS